MISSRRSYRKFKKITAGERFYAWTAITDQFPHPETRRGVVICRCECGTERQLVPAQLRGGHTRRCRACGNRSAGKFNRAAILKKRRYPFVVADVAKRLGMKVQAVYRMIYREGVEAVQQKLSSS